MKDGPIRLVIKSIGLVRYAVDLGITRAILRLRGQPAYRLTGSCNGCGQCCETPAIQTSSWVYYVQVLRDAFLWWQRKVNGFEWVGGDAQTHTFFFRCTHYDPNTQRCDSYHSRPGMCRDYPRNLLYTSNPQFFEACSYRPVVFNAATLSAGLDTLDLTPEQRKELEEKLHLKE